MDAPSVSNKIIYILGAVYVSYVFGKYMKGVEELPIVLFILLIMIAARNQHRLVKLTEKYLEKKKKK